jgi:hypothetical protein
VTSLEALSSQQVQLLFKPRRCSFCLSAPDFVVWDYYYHQRDGSQILVLKPLAYSKAEDFVVFRVEYLALSV